VDGLTHCSGNGEGTRGIFGEGKIRRKGENTSTGQIVGLWKGGNGGNQNVAERAIGCECLNVIANKKRNTMG